MITCYTPCCAGESINLALVVSLIQSEGCYCSASVGDVMTVFYDDVERIPVITIRVTSFLSYTTSPYLYTHVYMYTVKQLKPTISTDITAPIYRSLYVGFKRSPIATISLNEPFIVAHVVCRFRKVLLYRNIYVYMHRYVYMHMHANICICICISMYKCVCLCKYMCIYTCICAIYMYINVHIYICVCIILCACLYACVYHYICISTCICVYMYIHRYVYICICA